MLYCYYLFSRILNSARSQTPAEKQVCYLLSLSLFILYNIKLRQESGIGRKKVMFNVVLLLFILQDIKLLQESDTGRKKGMLSVVSLFILYNIKLRQEISRCSPYGTRRVRLVFVLPVFDPFGISSFLSIMLM